MALLMRRLLMGVMFVLVLTAFACQPREARPAVLPTQVPTDFDAIATGVKLTENAPPPRFREQITVPEIDQKTNEISAWQARVSLNFEGVFAGTNRQTRASTDAQIQFNLLGLKRRVVLTVSGDIFEQEQPLTTEGVRLGQDTYFVRDNVCAMTTGSEASAIADVGAGDLIGGIQRAVPDGQKAVINGAESWHYTFSTDDLSLANVQLTSSGRILYAVGEVWFAPEYETVVRFYLTMDVENATLFGSNVPVTGTVIMQYDLSDIGVEQNINVPFGC